MFELCGSALVLVWSGVALSPALSGPGSHCAAALSPPVTLSPALSGPGSHCAAALSPPVTLSAAASSLV